MQRKMLKSKIHRATLTGADLQYEGSVTIDKDLMEAADIIAYEAVCVWDVNNGSRFETYAIEGERADHDADDRPEAVPLAGCHRDDAGPGAVG